MNVPKRVANAYIHLLFYYFRYILGHLLCRSRSPDFLLDILQRQGSNQAMPWLADLVESSEGSFNVLPVQCLCEFLLNSVSTLMESEESENKDQKTKKRKQKQLLLHLQQLLQHPVTEQVSIVTLLGKYRVRKPNCNPSLKMTNIVANCNFIL